MESLAKHARTLTGVLEKEYEQYRRIFELVKQEQTVLANADINGLEENLRNQQVLIQAINKLESKRLQELKVIGVYLEAVPEKLKLSTIVENVPEDLSQQLVDLERKFKSVLQEILKINKSNKFLINRSLQFIDKNIQVFFGAMEEKGVYTPNNTRTQLSSKTNHLVDRRA